MHLPSSIFGDGGSGGGGGGLGDLSSPPPAPHAYDYEFEDDILDPAWSITNQGTDGLSSATAGIISTDLAPADVHYELNTSRKSWMLMQPKLNERTVVTRAATVTTNMLIHARLKFNKKISAPLSNEGGIGLCFCESNGAFADYGTNFAVCYLNESDATTQVSVQVQGTGPQGATVNLANIATNIAQPWEYVAIHKLGTTIDFWVACASGNWQHVSRQSGITTSSLWDRIGFIADAPASAVAPGIPIVGCDYIRVLETDTFIL